LDAQKYWHIIFQTAHLLGVSAEYSIGFYFDYVLKYRILK